MSYDYSSLDLNNSEDKKIYDRFEEYMQQNNVTDGEILKFFKACANYHCEEIIESLENSIKEKVDDLEDAPIIYLIRKIKDDTNDNLQFSFSEDILVNWSVSIDSYFDGKKYSIPLIDSNFEKEEQKVKDIMNKFSKKYGAIVNKENDFYIVKFGNNKSFDDFKTYSKDISKNDYYFEGDVNDLLRIKKQYSEIVELKPWDSYMITNTLAKVLGIRDLKS